MKLVNWLFVICLSLLFGTLFSYSLMDNTQIHGFISQGYIISQENTFLVSKSQDGSFELSEMGFTLSTNISPKFRIGFQLLSRDFGDLDNNNTKIDWGFADYRYKDYLGIRMGKVKMPMGLYNEGRDTDMLRSMALLPQTIYNEHYRNYFLSYQGLGIYGTFMTDSFGSFEYNAFYGGFNLLPEDTILKKTTEAANGVLYSGLVASEPLAMNTFLNDPAIPFLPDSTFSYTPNFNQFSYTDARADQAYGGTFFWNTPLEGLKVGASFFKVDLDFISPNTTGGFTISGNQTETVYLDSVITFYGKRDGGIPIRTIFSLEYIYNQFTIAAEYCNHELKMDFYDEDGGKVTAEFERDDLYYYVLGSYSFLDQFTLSLLYDYGKTDRMELITPSVTLDLIENEKDWLNERTDIGIGFKYDLNFNWSIKAEYHKINGVFNSYSTVLDDDPNVQLEEDWGYSIIKTSFNF